MSKRSPSSPPPDAPKTQAQAAPPASRMLAASELALLNAVFSGGYYIAYYNEQTLPQELQVSAQQKRVRKNEEALFLATFVQHLAEMRHQPPSEEPDHRRARHDQLMQELQALINRSDLVQNPHHEHLRHEIDVARQQLLRGGSFDDTIIMQTLQELAADQGLTLAGSSVASGRFVSDIFTPEESASADRAEFIASASAVPPVLLISDPLYPTEAEMDLHSLHLIDRFSAYDISQVGSYRHIRSDFFAQALKKALLEADNTPHKEHDPAEITPST